MFAGSPGSEEDVAIGKIARESDAVAHTRLAIVVGSGEERSWFGVVVVPHIHFEGFRRVGSGSSQVARHDFPVEVFHIDHLQRAIRHTGHIEFFHKFAGLCVHHRNFSIFGIHHIEFAGAEIHISCLREGAQPSGVGFAAFF